MTIRILYNGAAGKMGRLMTNGMLGEEDMQLVAAVDVQHVGEDAGVLAGRGPCGVLIENDLTAAMDLLAGIESEDSTALNKLHELAYQAAEEAAPQVTEAEEETVPQAAEEADPQDEA